MRPKRPKRRRSSAIYAPSLPSVRPSVRTPSMLTPTANVTMPPHSDRKRSAIVCLVGRGPRGLSSVERFGCDRGQVGRDISTWLSRSATFPHCQVRGLHCDHDEIG